MESKPVTPAIEEAHGALQASLPLTDTADFDDADRGFIASLVPGVVTRPDGHVVWDGDGYAFLAGEAPASVNPSLWRQSQLVAKQGLYEVVEGIYQVRGLDLSNITFVEGDTGVIVIDPLISTETAAAALGLYRAHRGERAVLAVIYSHSHVDHFGGVFGVTSEADVEAGTVQVDRTRGIRGACGRRERLRGHRDVAPGRVHVRRRARARSAGAGRGGSRPDDLERRGRPDRADPRGDHHRRDPHDRRRRDRVPDGARHRGAHRRCTSTSRGSAPSAWPRTRPTRCTTC